MYVRTATCCCGQLRVVCDGEPERVRLCNCTECQRRTGSAYGVNAYFSRTHVKIEGRSKPFRRSSDAGRWVETHFCPECGSTVYWHLEQMSDIIGVAAGAFTDPTFPAPKGANWTENKYHWVPLPNGIPTHSKQT